MKIGNVELENRIILGPMAGVTNKAFRKIVKQQGAALVVSEMISDKALYYGNEKTIDMLEIDDDEHPVAIQLFGGDPKTMAFAAKFVEEHTHCDIIDINMGCPVNKVIKAQSGSYLLQYPDLVYDIVKAVVDATHLPVTVKIRLGYVHDHINCREIAKIIESAGASAIALHARTRSQMYEGKADWSYIKKVKEAVNIPVIGNGDVKTPLDAKKMIDETGCDAVMVARAVQGNPFIIHQMVEYVENGHLIAAPSDKEKIDQCIKHAKDLCDTQGERIAIKQMRGQAPWYLKGMKGASTVENQLTQIESLKELVDILEDYRSTLEKDK